jgi:hypothetical protein
MEEEVVDVEWTLISRSARLAWRGGSLLVVHIGRPAARLVGEEVLTLGARPEPMESPLRWTATRATGVTARPEGARAEA